MPAFEYVALDAKGRQKRGVLEGDSPRAVRQQLREQTLTPLEVSVVEGKQERGRGLHFKLGNRMSVTELALFTRQLATLV
ncbi:MAG: type II secretion system protein GspF, partial [Nevskiales bacterium]